MPIAVLNKYTDDELAAVFAYLQSLPPIRNQVPTPIEPAAKTAAASPPGDGAMARQ